MSWNPFKRTEKIETRDENLKDEDGVLAALWSGMAVQGDVAGAMPREQMLLAFFRALTGLAPSRDQASPFSATNRA